METDGIYKSHVASMQNLKMFEGRKQYQAPFAEKFEDIYKKAAQSDIKLNNVKEFIEELSQDELHTLQKYAGLASEIDIGTLTPEGAYNLLMHDREQFDFNGDGAVEVGEGKHAPILPSNMPVAERNAFIAVLNSLESKDKLMVMTLTFDLGRVASEVNGMSFTPQTLDYTNLRNRVQQILDPKNTAYSSEAFKTSIRNFWEAFEGAFEGENKGVPSEEPRDPIVEKFLSDLKNKGALQFLTDFNQEKINEKVEAFRQKLINDMGDSPESMALIEEKVKEYRQQLLQELQESLDNSDKKIPTLNEQAMIQMILNMKDEKDADEPLTALLNKK